MKAGCPEWCTKAMRDNYVDFVKDEGLNIRRQDGMPDTPPTIKEDLQVLFDIEDWVRTLTCELKDVNNPSWKKPPGFGGGSDTLKGGFGRQSGGGSPPKGKKPGKGKSTRSRQEEQEVHSQRQGALRFSGDSRLVSPIRKLGDGGNVGDEMNSVAPKPKNFVPNTRQRARVSFGGQDLQTGSVAATALTGLTLGAGWLRGWLGRGGWMGGGGGGVLGA